MLGIPLFAVGFGALLLLIITVHLITDNKSDATSNSGSIKFSLSTIIAICVAMTLLLIFALPGIVGYWQQLGH